MDGPSARPTRTSCTTTRASLSAALGPERISTREIVAEQRIGARVQVTASLFQNHVSDLITQRSGSEDTLDGLYYQNLEGVTATGDRTGSADRVAGAPPDAHGIRATARRATRRRASASATHPAQVATVVLDAPVARTGMVAAFNGHYIGARRTVHDAQGARGIRGRRRRSHGSRRGGDSGSPPRCTTCSMPRTATRARSSIASRSSCRTGARSACGRRGITDCRGLGRTSPPRIQAVVARRNIGATVLVTCVAVAASVHGASLALPRVPTNTA